MLAIDRKLSIASSSREILTPNSCSRLSNKSISVSESRAPLSTKSASTGGTSRFNLFVKRSVSCWCSCGCSSMFNLLESPIRKSRQLYDNRASTQPAFDKNVLQKQIFDPCLKKSINRLLGGINDWLPFNVKARIQYHFPACRLADSFQQSVEIFVITGGYGLHTR